MTNPLLLILVGLITGVYSGIMGLGGGTVMIPIMVLALGFSQHQATATSLAAMIPPVTLPAVIAMYRKGHVNVPTAGWIALGIAVGSILGAMVSDRLSDLQLKLVFGFVLIYVGGYTIFNSFWGGNYVRSLLWAGALLGMAAILVMGRGGR